MVPLLLRACTLLLATAALAQTNALPAGNGANEAAKLLDAGGPAFEVAAIHLAAPDAHRSWTGLNLGDSGRFQTSAVPLTALVSDAYLSISDEAQVEADHAAPKWIASDLFDIDAKVDPAYMGTWSKLSYAERMSLIRPMLRRLLVERFHLKLALETRSTPVYALVQAKGGARVKQVPPPPPATGDPLEAQKDWNADHPGVVPPGSILCSGEKCIGEAVTIGAALGQIAANSHADRPVLDRTGLTGYYNFSFSFPAQTSEFPMQEVENDLGMKFERRSLPMTIYVIRSAERPEID